MLIPLLGGDRAASRNEIAQARALRPRPRRGRRRRRRRGGVRRLGAGARRYRRCRVCRPPGRAGNAACQGARRRQSGRLDLFRRAAPGRAAAQMAHRDRSRRARSRSMPCSRRCISAARTRSRRRSRHGARRGLPPPWPSSPTRCWNRGASRRSPTRSPSARCSRSRRRRGAARLSSSLRANGRARVHARVRAIARSGRLDDGSAEQFCEPNATCWIASWHSLLGMTDNFEIFQAETRAARR